MSTIKSVTVRDFEIFLDFKAFFQVYKGAKFIAYINVGREKPEIEYYENPGDIPFPGDLFQVDLKLLKP